MNAAKPLYWMYQFHQYDSLGQQGLAAEYVVETPTSSVAADLAADDSCLRAFFHQNLPTRNVNDFVKSDPNGALLFLGYAIAQRHCLLDLGEFLVHEQPAATALGTMKPKGLGSPTPMGRGVQLWFKKTDDKNGADA